MKLKNKISSLLLSLGLLTSAQSMGAVIVESGSQLLGANDVNVSGTLYNVRFVEGTVNSVYGSTPTFTWTNLTDASVAAQALLDQVLIGTYDEDVPNIFGIDHYAQSLVLTAYAVDSLVRTAAAVNNRDSNTALPADHVRSVSTTLGYDTGAVTHTVYASWEEAGAGDQGEVPVPATLALLGLGLAGLRLGRRDK